MNYIYIGKPSDYNIGNGKTSSAVGNIAAAFATNPDRTIFSNIELMELPYEKFNPNNISDVLETENALVFLDELHAIVHKNHKIHEGCGKHSVKGLCYLLSEFFRQVRKRKIDTHTTCQTFADCAFQYRQLMNVQIVCEKFHLEGKKLVKCKPNYTTGEECPEWHKHIIKQQRYPSEQYEPAVYFNPEKVYSLYNSFEIVSGWVNNDT